MFKRNKSIFCLANVIKKLQRLRKKKTKVKKCRQFFFFLFFFWQMIAYLLENWNAFSGASYNSPSLAIVTAHLNYMLDNFFNLQKGTSAVKRYTEANSIFLMVRWLCHLRWHYRLFSINICALIKIHLLWKHNDLPVKEILSINLKLISLVHTLYA